MKNTEKGESIRSQNVCETTNNVLSDTNEKRSALRQRFRKTLLIFSFLLYPATFAYISCPLITEAAGFGIVSGGLVIFVLIFLSSLIIGRLWCGYLCPSGGLQEMYRLADDRRAKPGIIRWLKYPVFLGIFGSMFYGAYMAGGFHAFDPVYGTSGGISIAAAGGVAMFYGPVMIIMIFTVIFGRRGFCHTFCPIAVMLIIGRKIRNMVGWPALHLTGDANLCIDCQKCTEECPMSLDVHTMLRQGRMEHTDCILCGNCVDTCPRDAIRYAWMKDKKRVQQEGYQ